MDLLKAAARRVIQGLGRRQVSLSQACTAEVLALTYENGVEKTGTSQSLVEQPLQPDAEREHRHQRGHAHADAQRGKRVTQAGFAQIAAGKFHQVVEFHLAAPILFLVSPRSLPSPRDRKSTRLNS